MDAVEQRKLIPIIKGIGVDMSTKGDFVVTKPSIDNSIDVFHDKAEEGEDDAQRISQGRKEARELISRMVGNQILKNNKVFLDKRFEEMQLEDGERKQVITYLVQTATSFVLDKINLSFPDTPTDEDVKRQEILDRVQDMIILKNDEEYRFYPAGYPFRDFDLVKQLKSRGFSKISPQNYAKEIISKKTA